MASSGKKGRRLEPTKDENGKNIKHLQPPKYAPFGVFQKPILHKNAYKPRDLLNYAVLSFHNRPDGKLSFQQLEARKDFVNRFKERKMKYGKDLRTGASQQSFQQDMTDLFSYLDKFFFIGLLRDNVSLDSGIDLIRDGGGCLRGLSGKTRWCTKQHDKTLTRLSIGTNSKLYELPRIVYSLIHEMVHAYQYTFGCDCVRCERDVPNTGGLSHDGHGPIFVMLHRLVLTEIRRWGAFSGEKELMMLGESDCPGRSMSWSARESARAAFENLDKRQKKLYHSLRSQINTKYLIHFSPDGEEVVVNESRLNNKRTMMEDYLQSQRDKYTWGEAKPTSTKGGLVTEIEDDFRDDSSHDDGDEDDDNAVVNVKKEHRNLDKGSCPLPSTPNGPTGLPKTPIRPAKSA
ncbi:uncharacterized protein GGS22DRAFT_194603 [Annulohypoxylon maeteangense]|uniref:uncharacterized protein n=1 Tax=Annulohypoxylon maeteangense TaxID=1927788 RepID=UPI0020079968|nr:uncharacterized protein GGS22DRAFT_194603 [Annulohypoxylon maeteangense]KAI0890685.1 hypothetical protein GGS22DRAFT_194603 [Annulohypoxylon maeteangense]